MLHDFAAKRRSTRHLRVRSAVFAAGLFILSANVHAQSIFPTASDIDQASGEGTLGGQIFRAHTGGFSNGAAPFAGFDADSSPSAAVPVVNGPSRTESASYPNRRPLNIIGSIFRKHRWDFSIEGARFHNNIPFVFDFLLGDGYNMTPLDYTLAPFILSFRWQLSGVHGHKMFRGTWEGSFAATYTMIPRGPETRYFAYIMGIRRNFVQPRWRVIPYVEYRVGAGDINAKEPYGVPFAQGQDFTFTMIMDSGFRYVTSDRYSLFFGAGYMHISNLYLSEPKYLNYGINVYGPMMGIDIRVGKHSDESIH